MYVCVYESMQVNTVYFYVCQSFLGSVCLFIYLTVRLCSLVGCSVCLSIYLSIYPSIHPSIHPSCVVGRLLGQPLSLWMYITLVCLHQKTSKLFGESRKGDKKRSTLTDLRIGGKKPQLSVRCGEKKHTSWYKALLLLLLLQLLLQGLLLSSLQLLLLHLSDNTLRCVGVCIHERLIEPDREKEYKFMERKDRARGGKKRRESEKMF